MRGHICVWVMSPVPYPGARVRCRHESESWHTCEWFLSRTRMKHGVDDVWHDVLVSGVWHDSLIRKMTYWYVEFVEMWHFWYVTLLIWDIPRTRHIDVWHHSLIRHNSSIKSGSWEWSVSYGALLLWKPLRQTKITQLYGVFCNWPAFEIACWLQIAFELRFQNYQHANSTILDVFSEIAVFYIRPVSHVAYVRPESA